MGAEILSPFTPTTLRDPVSPFGPPRNQNPRREYKQATPVRPGEPLISTQPPTHDAETPTPDAPHRSGWQVVIDFLNPVYHFRRFKEDMAVAKSALYLRKQILHDGLDSHRLPEIFRGMMMGIFFATGWTNMLGVAAGALLQRLTDNQWIGLYSTFFFCFVITAVAYQIGWYLDNRRLYAKTHADPVHRFLELQRDMWPIHKTALRFVVAFSIINIPLSTLIVGVITLISDRFAKNMPSGLVIMLVEALFVAGPFVRIMGDTFDKHSYVLAAKYRHLCGNG
ncbi:hypothetical protein [Aphanothece stagnina]|uniref:hypothetical protein n=1 Tax=Aphanothece stagnina TaxID=1004305 RepID=UPI00398F273D